MINVFTATFAFAQDNIILYTVATANVTLYLVTFIRMIQNLYFIYPV